MTEVSNWSTLDIAVKPLDEAVQVEGISDELGKDALTAVTSLFDKNSIDPSWSFFKSSPDIANLNITIKDDKLPNEDHYPAILDAIYSSLGLSHLSHDVIINSSSIRNTVDWASLQIIFEANLDAELPTPPPASISTCIDMILTALGRNVINPIWCFSSDIPQGLILNIALPVSYITHAASKLSEELLKELHEVLLFKKPMIESRIDAVHFCPSIEGVSRSSSGTTGIKYSIDKFCYAVSDTSISFNDLNNDDLTDIIKGNLRLQASKLAGSSRCLDDGMISIGCIEYDPDTFQTRKNGNGEVAHYCDLSFNMNVDLTGPFLFGVYLENEMGTLVGKEICMKRSAEDINYNLSSFGDMFAKRLTGLNYPYIQMQKQTAIYSSNAKDREALAKLCEEVAHFIELSALTENFPIECFSFEPLADDNNNVYKFALGFQCSDSTLINELQLSLNEIRFNNPDLSYWTDSFTKPLIMVHP
ncbi:hypothetical protein A1QO_00725 [Vibrio genomosp. F10 str. ZF-129]|uniref:Uncharacterized protein n=1 Tax=Vibrio genomosp. F10 str. ZF-129 TaxID=1187848 RepID=A0A1E5BGB6_9VIBR|nr:hypothetical protein [Vibrio genomosp. F10]OEE35316.1 hypothetical protein A1QO_00725 [Vibrio genomosp. F10 str. ZF-129]